MPKAKNLKYCRKKAGLTQQQLADELGVTLTTIRSWESKKTAMPVPSTKRVAKYFGLNYADFCDSDLERSDLGLTDDGVKLTAQELKGILMYRELPDDVKSLVRSLINVTHDYCKTKGVKP